MWDLPRPGLQPVSPALAGGFLTTVPPGKSHNFHPTMPLQAVYSNEFILHMCVRCAFTATLLAITKDWKGMSIKKDLCYANMMPVFDATSEIYNILVKKCKIHNVCIT